MLKKKRTKKRSFLNAFFGLDMIKRDIEIQKKAYQDIKKSSARSQFEETFEEAIERLGINEEQFPKIYNNFKKNAHIFFFASLLPIFYSFFYTSISIFEFFILFTIFLYFFMNGFKNSMHCYQIKNRKLNVIKDFIKKPLQIFIIKKYTNER